MRYRNFFSPWSLIAVAVSLSACADALQETAVEVLPEENDFIAAKIVNSPRNALRTELMFCTEDAELPLSGLSGLDAVGSLEKLFPSVPGKEEMEKRFGLDKWYLMRLEEGTDLEAAALSVAALPEVKLVEYSTLCEKASDGVTYTYYPSGTASLLTKAQSTDWCPYNDPEVAHQWHYYNTGDLSIAPTARSGADINVKDAWKLTSGDPSVIVAIIDEGVYFDHPDLQSNMWTNSGEIPGNGIDDDGNGYIDDVHGYNFAYGGSISCTARDSGHGTHIAGTISAVNNNGIGVCGIAGGNGSAGGVKIMSCQVFDSRVQQSAAGFARAFKYAADNGASIVQCSYGYTAGAMTTDAEYAAQAPAQLAAMDYFLATDNCPALDGSVAVYASGNEATAMAAYPGAYYKYIAVSSIAADNLPTYYTNYGPGVNISAPGGEYYTGGAAAYSGGVLSTLPYVNADTGYGYMQGTSMACPHVTGVAALGLSYMLKRGIKLTGNEFMSKILTAANDIDDLLTGEKTTLVGNSFGTLSLSPFRKNMGTGTIDAWRFLMSLDGIPCITAVVGKSQRLDISDYFGGCSKNLTYLSVEMSQEDKDAIGVSADPVMAYGRLKIEPARPGCARVRIRAIAGGEVLGDGTNMGGIELDRTISIIARTVKSSNGGWL